MVELIDKQQTFVDYGYTFQIKLLRALATDLDFLKRIHDILQIELFASESLAFIANVIKNTFSQYRQKVSAESFKIALKPIDDEILRVAVIENLKDIYKNTNDEGLEQIKDEAIEFCYNQNLKNTIFRCAELTNEQKYDEIKDLWKAAINAGMSKDLGHNYKQEVEERYSKELRNPQSTGIQIIDNLVGGGFGPGELITVIATSGVGKSWMLCAIGANSLKMGKKVLHYTLELDQAYSSRRYDAIITGYNFMDLDFHKDEVKKAMESLSGELYMKYYPEKSITVDGILYHAERMIDTGFKPDIVIVDYAGLIRPSVNPRLMRMDEVHGSIISELRGMAGTLKVPLYTAYQANRSAAQENFVTGEKVSNTYASVQTSDFIFSIARKIEDKISGTGRLHIIKNRFGPDGMTYPMRANLSNGRFDIYLEDSVEGKAVNRVMENDEEIIRKRLSQSYREMNGWGEDEDE